MTFGAPPFAETNAARRNNAAHAPAFGFEEAKDADDDDIPIFVGFGPNDENVDPESVDEEEEEDEDDLPELLQYDPNADPESDDEDEDNEFHVESPTSRPRADLLGRTTSRTYPGTYAEPDAIAAGAGTSVSANGDEEEEEEDTKPPPVLRRTTTAAAAFLGAESEEFFSAEEEEEDDDSVVSDASEDSIVFRLRHSTSPRELAYMPPELLGSFNYNKDEDGTVASPIQSPAKRKGILRAPGSSAPKSPGGSSVAFSETEESMEFDADAAPLQMQDSLVEECDMCLNVCNKTNSREAIERIKEALAKKPKPASFVYNVDGKLRVATKGYKPSKSAYFGLVHQDEESGSKLPVVAGKCPESIKIVLDHSAVIVAKTKNTEPDLPFLQVRDTISKELYFNVNDFEKQLRGSVVMQKKIWRKVKKLRAAAAKAAAARRADKAAVAARPADGVARRAEAQGQQEEEDPSLNGPRASTDVLDTLTTAFSGLATASQENAKTFQMSVELHSQAQAANAQQQATNARRSLLRFWMLKPKRTAVKLNATTKNARQWLARPASAPPKSRGLVTDDLPEMKQLFGAAAANSDDDATTSDDDATTSDEESTQAPPPVVKTPRRTTKARQVSTEPRRKSKPVTSRGKTNKSKVTPSFVPGIKEDGSDCGNCLRWQKICKRCANK